MTQKLEEYDETMDDIDSNCEFVIEIFRIIKREGNLNPIYLCIFPSALLYL